MNILTPTEISECLSGGPRDIARYIEQAILAKLSAGVSVEPYATLHHDDGYFTTKQREHDLRYSGPMRTEVVTLDQLNAATAAARVQENERCLAMMDAIGCDWRDAGDMAKFYATNYLREAIRALLGKDQS